MKLYCSYLSWNNQGYSNKTLIFFVWKKAWLWCRFGFWIFLHSRRRWWRRRWWWRGRRCRWWFWGRCRSRLARWWWWWRRCRWSRPFMHWDVLINMFDMCKGFLIDGIAWKLSLFKALNRFIFLTVKEFLFTLSPYSSPK